MVVLFMLLFGIIQFGIAFSQYESCVGAAREGARTAAVRGDNSSVLNAVSTAAFGCTPSQTPSIAVDGAGAGDPACTSTNVGSAVSVTWDQSFTIQIPFIPDMTPTATIKGVFRCE